MSDRINSITLFLDREIREDDAQSLLTCLRHIKGVIDVKPNISNGFDALSGALREDLKWRNKIIDLLKDDKPEK